MQLLLKENSISLKRRPLNVFIPHQDKHKDELWMSHKIHLLNHHDSH